LSAPSYNYGDFAGADWGENARFPATGRRFRRGGAQVDTDSHMNYWSASVSGDCAYCMYNYSKNLFYPSTIGYRTYGFSVRCVKE
jgi:hypothetical protein